MERRPVVAGKFYPSSIQSLTKQCEEFIGPVGKLQDLVSPIGLVLPHAGYVYSGKTAGKGIAEALKYGKPERIVLIGPNHTGYGEYIDVWNSGKWQVPNGEVEVDEEFTKELIDGKIIKNVEIAHLYEHSLEVQIPLFLYAYKSFKIIPIVMSSQSLEAVKILSSKLTEILKKYPSTLVVASSDFNHYEPHEVTLEKDEKVLEKILMKDIDGMYKIIKELNVTLCGFGPVAVVRNLFENAKLIYHTTSAEFSGDYSYTVGYESIIMY